MYKLFSNRYLDALAKTMLVSAIIHILLLVYIALRGRPEVLNVFSILGFDLLIPGLAHGAINFVISYVVLLVVYFLVYVLLTRSNDRSETDIGSHL